MDVQEILIRRQFLLALLEALLDHLLLLTKTLDLLSLLVLDSEELFLALLNLLLQTFFLLAQLRSLLHTLHRLSLRIDLDILQVHVVQFRLFRLLVIGFFEPALCLFEHELLGLHLPLGLLKLFRLPIQRLLLSCNQIR